MKKPSNFIFNFVNYFIRFLDKVDDRTLFVGLSIGIRVIEALGEAAFITASFIIILRECGGNLGVATTFVRIRTLLKLNVKLIEMITIILNLTGSDGVILRSWINNWSTSRRVFIPGG